MSEGEDNFLSRWARRKAEAAKAADTKPAATPDDAPPAHEPDADSEPFDLASLPSLDQLTAETDIRPFMHRLVPQELRNAALRRVWELDTSIRDYVSPATEYAWNFNIEGGAPGYGALEAGFDAAKAAARMFSQESEDHTLVEQDQRDSATARLASAKSAEIAKFAREQVADEAASGEMREVQSQTVRLSTETVSNSTIKTNEPAKDGAGAKADAPPADLPKNIAAPNTVRRHGGAAPH